MGYVWNIFRPPGVLMSELGFQTFGETGQALDLQRYDLLKTSYYLVYLTELLKVIHRDHVNIIGALAWSFIESNEFGSLVPHHGLLTLNHTTQERTYRRSMFDYVNFRSHVWK